MKPQEIDRLLATYRKNRARVEHLAIEISRMEAELGNQEKTAILHDALRAQTYGNVRKSSSRKNRWKIWYCNTWMGINRLNSINGERSWKA